MIEKAVSAAWIRGHIELFQNEGLNVKDLFSEAGLDMSAVNDPNARFVTDKVSRLWELGALRSGNPALGVILGCRAKPAMFDVVAYAMLSCPIFCAVSSG